VGADGDRAFDRHRLISGGISGLSDLVQAQQQDWDTPCKSAQPRQSAPGGASTSATGHPPTSLPWSPALAYLHDGQHGDGGGQAEDPRCRAGRSGDVGEPGEQKCCGVAVPEPVGCPAVRDLPGQLAAEPVDQVVDAVRLPGVAPG
jgi:hypothetical protein